MGKKIQRDLRNGRIVDDFIGEPYCLSRKLFSGLVSNLNSPLDSPTESKCFSQLHCDITPCILEPIFLQSLNDVTYNYKK